MTTAQTLLAELKARGISVREMSGSLRLSEAAAEDIAWAQTDAGISENPPSLGRQKMVVDQ